MRKTLEGAESVGAETELIQLYDESFKAKQRDGQFPKDVQSAYELGRRLVQKAKEVQN